MLPNGVPRTECEREEWYDLAPARIEATGYTAGLLYNTHFTQVQDGVGVFRHSSQEPEDLEDVWPKMAEPVLEREHEARIAPVDAAERRTTYWALGGLTGLFGGIITAAAIQDQSQTAANVIGISGVVIGLVGVAGLLASQPSGEDQLYANTRRKLLISGEDDLVAAARGIDAANARRRRDCNPAGVALAPVP